MPKIERCIPYTFDSYSGGMVPDPARTPNSGSGQQPGEPNSGVSNPASPTQSIELNPSASGMVTEEQPISPMTSDSESQSRPTEVLLDVAKLPPAATLHGYVAKYAAAAATRLVSKGSRKWLGDSIELYDRDQSEQVTAKIFMTLRRESTASYKNEETKMSSLEWKTIGSSEENLMPPFLWKPL